MPKFHTSESCSVWILVVIEKTVAPTLKVHCSILAMTIQKQLCSIWQCLYFTTEKTNIKQSLSNGFILFYPQILLHPEWNSDVKKWLFSCFFSVHSLHFFLKNRFFSMTGKKVIKWMSNGFSIWYLMRINHCFDIFSFLIDVEAFYSFLL